MRKFKVVNLGKTLPELRGAEGFGTFSASGRYIDINLWDGAITLTIDERKLFERYEVDLVAYEEAKAEVMSK